MPPETHSMISINNDLDLLSINFQQLMIKALWSDFPNIQMSFFSIKTLLSGENKLWLITEQNVGALSNAKSPNYGQSKTQLGC